MIEKVHKNFMEFPEIHFGGDNPKLRSYRKYYWNPGETRMIEFYPKDLTPVTLLYSSDPSLYDKLSTLIDGHPISLDLEWSQPWNHSPHPIELFQFTSSKGTIVVASDQSKGYDQISRFLHSATFFGKGMSSDKKKLRQCCNGDFDSIEDIEQTRLIPHNLTVNFESLTMMFLGPGTAKFKDHKVQRSNWSVRPLTILQVLYGAHDSYSMLNVYKKIIEKFGPEIKKVTAKPKSEKNKKKEKAVYSKCKCNCIDIDEYFVKNGISIDYDRPYDEYKVEMLCEKKKPIKEVLFEYEKKKSVDVVDEDSCFIQYADQVLAFLQPTQPKVKRYLHLERICLASDLLFLGILHHTRDGTFVCQVCDKHLHDPIALIHHCESRHCNDITIDHGLRSMDVFLHYLTSTDQVKCPFEIVFESSQLKNMVVEEEDEGTSDDDDDTDNDDGLFNNNVIVPKTYSESDGIKCCICTKDFESVDDLKNHCWLNHYEMFVAFFNSKGNEKESEKDDGKLNHFGSFCIKKLNMAVIDQNNLSIKCCLCDFTSPSVAKFFMHAFFKHRNFAIVRKEQYNKWPIRYDEFNDTMMKMVHNVCLEIDIDELEKLNLFSIKENRCVDCNVIFKDDEERKDHFMKNHLIYFPLVASFSK